MVLRTTTHADSDLLCAPAGATHTSRVRRAIVESASGDGVATVAGVDRHERPRDHRRRSENLPGGEAAG